MSRLIGVSLAAWCLMLAAVEPASAQRPPPYLYNQPTYGPGFRPQLSPYLNLTGRNDPAVNYFLQTLPAFENRYTRQTYGAAIAGLEAQALNPTPPAAPDVDLFTPQATTGHPTAFQNTGGYFQNAQGRPQAAAPTTRPPGARPPAPGR